ncbi:pirin family protein [Terrimonas sp. NA20]|uniref:Pirin family protein n=1 Tax=Terrimonas ginsenosidimutans TaxID=2908004 RepID=A0ABS9KXF3_9BACT|nr:pirin family protein [Terrimonas ginsenosidimutans]MCG2617000.1 pirin family protein [Terrimonas ginsenosidimutans]
MLQKISNSAFKGHGPIQVLYPGLSMADNDSGIGSIGRIDHAHFEGKFHIAMHPHINDEILSYFRTGKVRHLDSEGFSETIGGKRLMLMKAGRRFYHEEDIDGEAEAQEGLQIFIRPGEKDLEPKVLFEDLDELYSENEWRLLASPEPASELQFSSKTWIYDIKLHKEVVVPLPSLPAKDLTGLLYVFNGSVLVNQTVGLNKKEAIIFRQEELSIHGDTDTELVLFLTDETASIFKRGMYSGNQVH